MEFETQAYVLASCINPVSNIVLDVGRFYLDNFKKKSFDL